MNWLNVCKVTDLQPNSGVCALVSEKQIALFYFPKQNAVYAISNFDPFGEANVLSRGIVGDLKGEMVVASPLHKEHFNLKTGVCLEYPEVKIPAYACRIDSGFVQIPAKLL